MTALSSVTTSRATMRYTTMRDSTRSWPHVCEPRVRVPLHDRQHPRNLRPFLWRPRWRSRPTKPDLLRESAGLRDTNRVLVAPEDEHRSPSLIGTRPNTSRECVRDANQVDEICSQTGVGGRFLGLFKVQPSRRGSELDAFAKAPEQVAERVEVVGSVIGLSALLLP